jgi:hypothetical protein
MTLWIVLAGGAAVEPPGDAPVVVGLVVVARCEQGQHCPRWSRHAAEVESGRGKHEPSHPMGGLVGELLGERATERDAERVDPLVPEDLQHPLHSPGHAGQVAWHGIGGGLSSAGSVEADRLHPMGVQRPLERLRQLQTSRSRTSSSWRHSLGCGGTMSCLRILPVAVFGSASTIHTCRGYL